MQRSPSPLHGASLAIMPIGRQGIGLPGLPFAAVHGQASQEKPGFQTGCDAPRQEAALTKQAVVAGEAAAAFGIPPPSAVKNPSIRALWPCLTLMGYMV